MLAANYPFATIEPNTGVVPVPDARLAKLGELFNSQKIVPATVTFVDIAGLVAGAHKGEGMGNAFLSNIRETDAIAQVVRVFKDDDVQHVANRVHPQDDIDIINSELILADLQTIEKHIPKLVKLAKTDPQSKKLLPVIEAIQAKMDQGVLAINAGVDLDDIKYLNLLTAKPFIYVFNLDEAGIIDQAEQDQLRKIAPSENVVFVSAKIEAEISEMDDLDAELFMAEYGLAESGLERLSKIGFETLGLQTYLTAGEKETKAWQIKKGFTAPQAAGVIHGDFERGFIAADIVSYPDLLESGSLSAARSVGKVRTEGKDYIMQPDDVVEFKFNV